MSDPPDPIDAFFAQDGQLAAVLPGYEQRQEQVEVAQRVAAAVRGGGTLAAEAGTGVGKTLAYLLPAVTSQRKIVISTGTKNLQDQILTKDLPLVEEALGAQVDVQVMKGRTNYLCLLRADRIAAQPNLPGIAGDPDLDTVLEWRDVTETGDRAELATLPDNSKLWRELTATSEQCIGRACHDYERCWVTQMRRRAQTADLLIVNHHLYFADVSLRQRVGDGSSGGGLLPAHDLVIFDEAHDLDEVAAQHFGFQVSDRRIFDLIFDIDKAINEEPEVASQIRPLLDGLERRTKSLFDSLPFADGRKALAGPTIHHTDRQHEVDVDLERIENALAAATFEEAPAMARRAALIAAELAFVLDVTPRRSVVSETELAPNNRAFVRYCERTGRTRSVVARPLDVAESLRPVFDDLPSIFVSATLTVGGDFDHFRNRLGLTRAKELLVGSPFDYENNARLYLPTDLPLPQEDAFGEAAAERAADLVAAAGGGAFVLCTSYRNLPLMRAAIERACDAPVLMQGEAPRTRIIEQFRADGHAVLVATMSFWQGVDVPGDALRLVVIDKLPFASPGDPLVKARLNYMRDNGEDAFMGYQVPTAALLLRQGFGRLIRRQTDRGMVAVLDPRITQKGYGRVFRRSLPDCPTLYERDEAVAFLNELRAELNDA